MLKNLIAPIQMWLLSQGRCVGCGQKLASGVKKTIKGKETITCASCGRIFIYQASTSSYRRALLSEI